MKWKIIELSFIVMSFLIMFSGFALFWINATNLNQIMHFVWVTSDLYIIEMPQNNYFFYMIIGMTMFCFGVILFLIYVVMKYFLRQLQFYVTWILRQIKKIVSRIF